MEKKVKIRGVWGKFSRGKPGESDFDQGNINCILVFYLPLEAIDIFHVPNSEAIYIFAVLNPDHSRSL